MGFARFFVGDAHFREKVALGLGSIGFLNIDPNRSAAAEKLLRQEVFLPLRGEHLAKLHRPQSKGIRLF